MATSGGRTSKNAIYTFKKNKSHRWRTLRARGAKKKRWEECGWNRGPLGSLSYGRSETAETSCLCVWTQRCLPIAPLNYCKVPRIYRKHPQTEKNINYHVFCFLYIQQYMTQSREIKTMPTATLVYVEHGLPPFSQGCECLTRARDSLLSAFQRKAAAQRAFSACRPRSDETAFWHTLSRPPVSGPQGSGQQRTGYCKSKQSSRWGTQAGCQPGSKEIPSHCYTQPKKIIHNCSQRQ